MATSCPPTPVSCRQPAPAPARDRRRPLALTPTLNFTAWRNTHNRQVTAHEIVDFPLTDTVLAGQLTTTGISLHNLRGLIAAAANATSDHDWTEISPLGLELRSEVKERGLLDGHNARATIDHLAKQPYIPGLSDL